jgi:hypothetical protein
MSRSTAAVRFPDGKIMTGIFNGTVGMLFSRLIDTPNRREAWDVLYPLYKSDPAACFTECVCGEPSEVIDVATDYGYGLRWKAMACRRCLHVVGPLNPFEAHSEVDDYLNPRGWGQEQGTPEGLPQRLRAFEGTGRGLPDWWHDTIKS